MTNDPDQRALRGLLDRQAITDVIYRYSRAVDRKDYALLASVYWPDAVDDHIAFSGDVAGFIAWVSGFTGSMNTTHFIGNILIEFQDDEHAFVETYVIGFHDMPGATGREDFVGGGRYLDRLEKRGDEWRIARRDITLDFQMRAPSSADWNTGILANLKTRGAAKPVDPLYRFHPAGENA
jgi:ketosteroid isomerase-like protein